MIVSLFLYFFLVNLNLKGFNYKLIDVFTKLWYPNCHFPIFKMKYFGLNLKKKNDIHGRRLKISWHKPPVKIWPKDQTFFCFISLRFLIWAGDFLASSHILVHSLNLFKVGFKFVQISGWQICISIIMLDNHRMVLTKTSDGVII